MDTVPTGEALTQGSNFVYYAFGLSVTAIVALALYARQLQKVIMTKLIDVIVDNTKSNDHLAEAIDDLKQVVISKRK